MSKRILVILSLVVLLLTVFIVAEFEARLYIAQREARVSNFDTYPNEFYLDKQEANKILGVGSDGLWYIYTDYHSQYINIDNLHRRTTGQPVKARHTLYFFGASTGFDIQVSDSDTIPSKLQARLGSSIKVINMSVAGMPLSSKLS